MRVAMLVVLMCGCGEVMVTQTDAGQDSGSSSGSDAAMMADANASETTAIAATDVAQFQATAGVFTKIPYGATDHDDLSEWDMSTSTFTAKNAGDYLFCASLYLTNNLAETLELDLFKNGGRDRMFARANGIVSGCRTIRLSANDKVDVRVKHSSNANIVVAPQPQWQWLDIQRVTSVAAVATASPFSSTSGQFTTVPYSQETYDDDSLFNTTNSTFVATTPGDYQFCPSLTLSTPTLEGEIDLFVNGSRRRAVSNGVNHVSGCYSLRLLANDVVAARFYQNTMATTIPTDPVSDWMAIQRMPISATATGVTTFSIPSHVYTKVPYSTELFDDHDELDTGTSTFTAATAGDYLVCASLLTHSAVDGDEIDIYKNDVLETGISYGRFALGGCHAMRLAANDRLTIWTYTASNVTDTTDTNWDWFQVTKLR